ncbi:MAG: nucleotide exchange factor GrpE [Pyrinomonadaceae bacterium]|nr:nucleotide exchange factor GrpE [Pyrinomonadaceae bacterium]
MEFFKRKKQKTQSESASDDSINTDFSDIWDSEMNEQDINETDETNEPEVRVNDKRHSNANGKTVDNKEVKSADFIKLENELIEERKRRDAAETKLIEVQARFEQVKNSLERETAEMRQRLMKTLEERAKQGQFNFLVTLLPNLDNLNLAIAAAEKDASFEKLIGGVRGTASGFENALMNVGVEIVESIGAKFNPEFHEAVDVVEVDAAHDEIVTKEYSRGYKYGDRLLRSAKVQVGRASNVNAAAE